MSVKDIKSNLRGTLVQNAVIGTDTATNGSIIDTADYELGLMFSVLAPSVQYTDGNYALSFEESDSETFASGVTAIAGDQLIGPDIALTSASALPTGPATIDGDLGSQGVISNKRYVRSVITSTGTTTGATLLVLCTQMGEVLAQPDLAGL